MAAVVSVDFTGYEEIYEDAKSSFIDEAYNGLIFDDEYNTIWIVWW